LGVQKKKKGVCNPRIAYDCFSKNLAKIVVSLKLGKENEIKSPRLVRNPAGILTGVCLLIRYKLRVKWLRVRNSVSKPNKKPGWLPWGMIALD